MTRSRTLKTLLLGGAALSAAGAWLLFDINGGIGTASAAMLRAQESQYETLDPTAADEIDRLAREIGLDDDSLSSTELTQEQLNDVFARLRSWYDSNAGALRTRWSAVADAHALKRIARSTQETGSGETPEFDVGAAETQLASTLAQALAAAVVGLSPEQRADIAAVASRKTIPMPYRVLALGSEQEHALQTWLTQRSLRASHAGAGEHAVDPTAGLSDAIGSQNVTALDSFASARAARSARIVLARNTVLPRNRDSE